MDLDDIKSALRIAQHEVGHALAAEMRGCTDIVASIDAGTWAEGTTRYMPPERGLSELERRFIGLAGFAAECLAKNANVTARELASAANAPDGLAARGDRAETGEVDEMLAQTTLDLLSPYRGTIRRRALELVLRTQDQRRGVVRLRPLL